MALTMGPDARWDCGKKRLIWTSSEARGLKSRAWLVGDDQRGFVKVFPRPAGLSRALEDYLKDCGEPDEVFPLYAAPLDFPAFRRLLREENKEERLANWQGWEENWWGRSLPKKTVRELVITVR